MSVITKEILAPIILSSIDKQLMTFDLNKINSNDITQEGICYGRTPFFKTGICTGRTIICTTVADKTQTVIKIYLPAAAVNTNSDATSSNIKGKQSVDDADNNGNEGTKSESNESVISGSGAGVNNDGRHLDAYTIVSTLFCFIPIPHTSLC